MKKSFRRLVLPLFLLPLTGCLYANFRTPLDTDVSVTKLGSKTGHASWQSILGLIAWGDAGAAAAARDGGITTLNHMDREVLWVLGFLYTRDTTIVYGD